MKVLLVGGGGREHALAWRLKGDDPSLELFAAPGNPGIADCATCVDVAATDLDGQLALARRERVSLTIVGPEAPLAAGIVDRFRAEGLTIFGPTRAAAEIETSKSFAKRLMLDAGVPTARAITFTEPSRAKGAARELGAPVVIKASGLAAGKGVIVCPTLAEADRAIETILVDRAFGVAGSELLVEEFMEGEEVSIFAVTNGTDCVLLPPAQDHKRLLNGDAGPNTGGMGAYAPAFARDPSRVPTRHIVEHVFEPTLAALRARGTPFTGLLYAGLMLTASGPQVVEFNCRFGDPETQAILPVMGDGVSLLELLLAAARGNALPHGTEVAARGHAVSTVLAAYGYPERPRAGDRIGLPAPDDDVVVFHAGTRRDRTGALITAGGRVFAITGLGATIEDARARSLRYARAVAFDGKQFRTDIGWRELARSAPAGHAGAP